MDLPNLLDIVKRRNVLYEYEQAEYEFAVMVDKTRESLEKFAKSGKAKAGYVNKMNYILKACYDYFQASEKLHNAIGETSSIFHRNNEAQTLKHKLKHSEEENRKMKAWLLHLGKDITLLHHINKRDFQI